MTQTKKAPAAATTGANANPATNNESRTRKSIIPCPATEFKKILRYIPEGRENAIHLRELVKLCGIPERTLRKCIELLIVNGCGVLAGDEGYWRADFSTEEGAAEAARYCRRERSRAVSITRKIDATRKATNAARSVGMGQTSMDGWG